MVVVAVPTGGVPWQSWHSGRVTANETTLEPSWHSRKASANQWEGVTARELSMTAVTLLHSRSRINCESDNGYRIFP